MPELLIKTKRPHDQQRLFINSKAKRKIIRAGRRSGKTIGISIYAARKLLYRHRVLYAAPTQDQLDTFWTEVKNVFREPIAAGFFYKNETKHIIEIPGSKARIRAKTAWNADTLRGDFADELILDEWQLMNEEAWEKVGAPMLLDNNGNATFIFTPRPYYSKSVTKAIDPLHASKMFQLASRDKSGRWAAFHFSSFDNPHISREALDEITSDMTSLSYKMEILAEDIRQVPGALWTREIIDQARVIQPPDMIRIVVAVDPQSTTGTTGIIVAGLGADKHFYILEDSTVYPGASPATWAGAAIAAFNRWKADRMIAEINHGGQMVTETIKKNGGGRIPIKTVRATRGKATRAEPIAAMFEDADHSPRKAHLVGYFAELEDQLCTWKPGQESPDRLDAMVWAGHALMIKGGEGTTGKNPFYS